MNENTENFSGKSPNSVVLILGGLIAVAPLTVDLYLPAFPAIAQDLNASAGLVQSTLASYLIGMAIGQMFYGPITDRYGRKLPLYVGLIAYALATLGCMLATTIDTLLLCRFLQALGGCATVVVTMAMVRDLYDQQSMARVMSRLMLVMGVAPLIAPMLGSQLLLSFGWRSIFATLFIYALLCLLAVRFRLPESLRRDQAKSVSIAQALRTYAGLLKDRQYMGYSLAGSFGMAGMLSYIAGSPFVFINLHEFSPRAFSLMFGVNVIGLIGASQLNHQLMAKYHPATVMRVAVLVLAIFGIGLFASTLIGISGSSALAILLLLLFGFMSSLGFINPNTTANAMAGHAHQAGSAAALLGTLQFVLGTLSAVAVGVFNDGTAHAMCGVMAFCAVAALLCHRILLGSSK